MTPQANFMVLAAIDPAHEAQLRQLLDSMNDAPGQVNPGNPLVPFAQFDAFHFARFVILNDGTLNDVRAYGGEPAPAYPLYLAFLGDIDGDADRFRDELAARAGDGLRRIFSCCAGFTAQTDLVRWMKEHEAPAIAAYVNWRGRTARQIQEEAALRDALENHLKTNASEVRKLPARQAHAKLRQFLKAEMAAGRLKLTPEAATPIDWWIRNALHLIGVPLLALLLLPLLVLIAPIYIFCLRRLEKTDPELCWRVDQGYSDGLSVAEDRYVTNQFVAMGSVKPGLVRRMTLIGVLSTVDYAARHFVRRGRLGRIRTIHFARWVFLDGKKRMVFFSNYDGTVESYMDDFINKTGFGLNAVFSAGIGYPRTNWLVLDGCDAEQKYKDFLRRHTLPSQVWYKAYPGLTAIDLERNSRIRGGLESRSLSEQEACEWAALL
ncbi:MAG TPA: hypothetical protein VGW39_13865 [Chthoniobacterales bacterium]|nr:hypothetical protein [Chthoniobacterales bacterium]